MSPETMELLKENIGNKNLDIGLIFGFFSGKGSKNKNKQLGLYQTKSFCTVKETINKMKRKPTEWENIFASGITGRG